MAKKNTAGEFDNAPVTSKNPKYVRDPGLTRSTTSTRINAPSSPSQGLVESPFEEDYFNSKILGIDLGEVDNSAFSPFNNRDPFNSNIDFEKIRADRQSTLSKLGANGVSFLARTSAGIVGNIVGGFYGMGKAIGEGDSSYLFDNEIYRNIDDFNEFVEKKNTVFTSSKDGLGFNMKTFKEVSDAFSFIAQAAGSELIMNATGVGLAGAVSRMGRYTNVLNKMTRIGRQIDGARDIKQLEALALELGTTVDKLSRAKRLNDGITAGTGLLRRSLTTTGYEASLEARQTMDTFLEDMETRVDNSLKLNNTMSDSEKAAYKAQFMERAKEQAEKAGLATFALNTAVLQASNMMQFPSIFGPKYVKANRLWKMERQGLGQAKRVDPTSRLGKVSRGLSTVARVVKNPVTEFTEETLQKAFSEAPKSYYESMLATDTNTDILLPPSVNLAQAMWNGLEEAYGTKEGLHEGIIGAIVGAIGLPGFKKSAKGGRTLTMRGGIAGSLREMRETRAFNKEAIDSLNSIKMSDVVQYKRDNAILGAEDAEREDASVMTDNKVRFEEVQNNKVFRYTMDRMRFGKENFIAEDIAELKQMPLEQYKQTFQKDEQFTEQDKAEELNAFEEKTNLYRDAFKKVHKSLDLPFGYQLDNRAFNSLSDILTHTVASEKMYGDILEKKKTDLYNLMNGEFTPSEIESFSRTSAKVLAAQSEVDEYIRQQQEKKSTKELNKRAKSLEKEREKLDPEVSKLTELSIEKLDENLALLEEVENKDETIQQQITNINEAKQFIRDNQDLFKGDTKQFDPTKSSTVRKAQKPIEELVKELNKKFETQTSAAMENLGVLPKKITTSELQEYLQLKDGIAKAIADRNNTSYILDLNEEDASTAKELINEIGNLTNIFTEATEIAASLFGMRTNPHAMYKNLQASQLLANIESVKGKIVQALQLQINETVDRPVMENLVTDINDYAETIKQQRAELGDALTKKYKDYADESIAYIEEFLSNFNDYLVVVEKQEKQATDGIVPDYDMEAELAKLDAMGLRPEVENETDDTIENDYVKRRDQSTNRFVITELNQKGQPRPSNPGFPTIQEAINNGVIKDKAAATLRVSEKELLPKDNAVLAELLGDKAESYIAGYNKVLNDIEALDNPDTDVLNFIRYAPVTLDIYDKVADRTPESTYEFELVEEDTSLYQQYMPAITEPGNISANSNEQMRTDVLRNFFNNTNELKLKVHNVNQGEFETFRDPAKVVEERSLEELGLDPDTVDPTRIVYSGGGNRANSPQRKIYTIEREDVNDIPFHPLQHYTKLGDGATMFYLHKDQTGREVPVKLNISRLNPTDVDLILKEMEKYIMEPNKEEYLVQVSEKDNPILHNHINSHTKGRGIPFREFMDFYLKPKRSRKKGSVLLLKNTYQLHTKNTQGRTKFNFMTDGANSLEVLFPEAIDGNEGAIKDKFEQIKEELRQRLLGQRHNFNVEFFRTPEKTLDRKALKMAIDSKLLNHPFNVEQNFDRIYMPTTRKSVSLSRADITDVSTGNQNTTFADVLQIYRDQLIKNPDRFGDEYAVNVQSVYFDIQNSVDNSLYAKLRNIDDPKSLTKAEKTKLISDSIKTAINKRVKEIEDIGLNFPNQFTPTMDHQTNSETLTNDDRTLDKLTKIMYSLQKRMEQQEFLDVLVKKFDTFGSMTTMMNAFKRPPAGTNISIMEFENEDGSFVQSGFVREEQVVNLTRVLKVLEEFAEAGLKPEINYTEAYLGKDKINTKRRKFFDKSRLSRSQWTDDHRRTIINSVDFREDPVWSDGKLIAGKVYINVQTSFKDKDGKTKVGNQNILVLSKDMALEGRKNIMTSMSIPYLSNAGMNLNPKFEQLYDDMQEYLSQRKKATAKALAGRKKNTVDSLPGVSVDSVETGLEQVERQLEEAGAVETPAPREDVTISYNKGRLSKTAGMNVMKDVQDAVDFPNDTTQEDLDFLKISLEKDLGINNIHSFVDAVEESHAQGTIEVSDKSKYVKLGEKIFNQKLEDCE